MAQFQYQSLFEPVFVPVVASLPLIVQPCIDDLVVEILPSHENAQYEEFGVTLVVNPALPLIVQPCIDDQVIEVLPSHENTQYEEFTVTLVVNPALPLLPQPVMDAFVIEVADSYTGETYYDPLVIAGPAVYVFADYAGEIHYVESIPDYSNFPSIFEWRGPIALPGIAASKSLIEYFNLTVRLDVKKTMDGGSVAALSTDPSGTQVNFNKAFKSVDAPVATVQETTAFIVVIDFVSVPNPTGFKVYVFDRATGSRASKTVYWTARGIL